MKMKKLIEVKNISKSFGEGETKVDVLKSINLDINEGEFVSIMGPSGSGKSTLLYLIGGLDKPTVGSILLDGEEVSGLNDRQGSILRRRKMGFVFQFYNLVPNLNVEDNVLLPLLLDGKKIKDCKKQLDELLDIVGLTHRRKHLPRELSGGQQQRVAIARALIHNPDLILADEPIGNLDSKTGMQIMQLLQDIHMEKKKTIVQVTHSNEAAKFGTRTIMVKDGCIL